MTPRLLSQLAFVATFDADAIEDRYAWPPSPPLSAAELDDVANLRAVADACFERAEAAGWEGGTDAAFGGCEDSG